MKKVYLVKEQPILQEQSLINTEPSIMLVRETSDVPALPSRQSVIKLEKSWEEEADDLVQWTRTLDDASLVV